MHKGQKMSDALRRHLCEVKKQNPTRYWLGKRRPPHSAETKAKMSRARIGHKRPHLGLLLTNKGKFGKEHPSWKESKKHPFHKSIRETYKYREWRTTIFTRDLFLCILCGTRGSGLNADHYPRQFIDIIESHEIKTLEQAINCTELWDTNNGRTLCVECHRKTDTYGRRKGQ